MPKSKDMSYLETRITRKEFIQTRGSTRTQESANMSLRLFDYFCKGVYRKGGDEIIIEIQTAVKQDGNQIMPVERKSYSVKIQMIFAIIPIVDLWASYRIKKFRIYVLIVWIGFGILFTITDWAIYGDDFWDEDFPLFPDTSSIIIYILEIAIEIIIAMILIRKWTIEWNKKIESTEK